MAYYTPYSEAAYQAHRQMLKNFDDKYPTLAAVANTLLYPSSPFQSVFDGLEEAPVSKEIKCPGAPERKRSRTD